MRQQSILADFNVIHHNFARDRRAQRKLVADLRCTQTLHAFLKHKAANFAAMLFRLSPNNKNVCDWTVGNPHFRTGDLVTRCRFHRAGFHACGV